MRAQKLPKLPPGAVADRAPRGYTRVYADEAGVLWLQDGEAIRRTGSNTYGINVAADGRKIGGSPELTVTKTATGTYEIGHTFGDGFFDDAEALTHLAAVVTPAVAGRVAFVSIGRSHLAVAIVDQLAVELADGGFSAMVLVL